MKGIVFTEFVEMVEEKFGFEISDLILSQPALKSKGVYTAVGTYEIEEMLVLLNKLSSESGIPIPELLKTFGSYLFKRFYHLYPHFFENKIDSFDFLSNIEDYIHVEVLKLYHDAQLPTIETTVDSTGKQMTMLYKSSRKLSDLACGLINGCIDHFNENIVVTKENIKEDGSEVRIVLLKR